MVNLLRSSTQCCSISVFPGCLYTIARRRLAAKLPSARRQWLNSRATSTKPWYGTTPIFYVNAAPHVGHLYSIVLADILKRWNLLRGRRALLCTGTDEHGMKVQRAAELANSAPRSFCDAGAEVFRSLAAKANVSNDHFIRTTDPSHRDAVQYAWTVLQEKDLIYMSKHEGWYSVSDETFYPPSSVQLTIDAPTGRKMMTSIETGKEVEWTSETNYRFRLSAFRDRLLQFYEARPDFIKPVSRMKDVIQAVEAGLEDLSISRPSSRLSWGIPVPNDDSQTIYVWLDALLNYATVTGFPWPPGGGNEGGWPPNVHVIGKDIVRFHCIYWPAFLMGLGAPLPEQILTHAHWTLGKEKMAKSTGNVVNPFFAIDRFGVDAMRFYLAHDGGIQQDSDYGNEFIAERYKKGLQGGLGNLSSRVLRGKAWDVRRAVERATAGELELDKTDTTRAQWALLERTSDAVTHHFNELSCAGALKEVMSMIYATNGFLAQVEPWKLAAAARNSSDDQKQLDCYVFLCAEAIRIAAILLQPFIPEKASKLLEMLGVDDDKKMLEFAKLGRDGTYGKSKVELGSGLSHVLFPPLLVEN